MRRGTQRRDIRRAEVLHLVDEDRHPDARGPPRASDVAQQLDEVDLDVTGVGPPGGRRHVDADAPPVPQPPSAATGTAAGSPARLRASTAAAFALRECLDDPEHLRHLVRARMAELAHRHMHRRRQRPSQRLVRPCLEKLARPQCARTAADRRALSSTVLPPPQPGEHDRAFRPPARHPLQRHVEGVQLLIAAGELRRPLPGARAYGLRIGSMIGLYWTL